jgi:putative transcriptional regulator
MNIKHHLDEATIISYAAGSLSQAMAFVVACHISVCPSCRARVTQSEAIGGQLLDTLEETAVSDDALDSVLARLDETPQKVEQVTFKQAQVDKDSCFPGPLQACLAQSLDEVEWKRIVPGVHYYDLPYASEKGGVSRLLKLAPGKSMLSHSHDGDELTLILRGSYRDEMGRFTAGDIADLDSDITHQPLVDGDEDCICLVATDAPLKFTTLLGKLMQPMTGF